MCMQCLHGILNLVQYLFYYRHPYFKKDISVQLPRIFTPCYSQCQVMHVNYGQYLCRIFSIIYFRLACYICGRRSQINSWILKTLLSILVLSLPYMYVMRGVTLHNPGYLPAVTITFLFRRDLTHLNFTVCAMTRTKLMTVYCVMLYAKEN